MSQLAADQKQMSRAFELARKGIGWVEPNPIVGCVIVNHREVVGEGYHARFGGDHAEVVAIEQAGDRAAGGTVYVTLEPCSHHGKTPPCADLLIERRVARVVVAQSDPFSSVAGQGLQKLREAGIEVELGLGQNEARALNAPYLKLIEKRRPWIIVKWAMTLDGKIATHRGDSQWISNPPARAIVHQLRGRMDAIMIGSGTASADDPLLTARPEDTRQIRRVATRVVVDSMAHIATDSQLVETAREIPLLVACGPDASAAKLDQLQKAGVEVQQLAGDSPEVRLQELLDELGRRKMTNVLVEGGGRLSGSLFDLSEVDEVHAFIAPRLVGGAEAPTPLAGRGVAEMVASRKLENAVTQIIEGDVYLHGRLAAD